MDNLKIYHSEVAKVCYFNEGEPFDYYTIEEVKKQYGRRFDVGDKVFVIVYINARCSFSISDGIITDIFNHGALFNIIKSPASDGYGASYKQEFMNCHSYRGKLLNDDNIHFNTKYVFPDRASAEYYYKEVIEKRLSNLPI